MRTDDTNDAVQHCSTLGTHYSIQLPSYAARSFATSSLCIWSMACTIRPTFSESSPDIISSNSLGTICQDMPYLSFSQPHMLSSPPSAVSASHSRSTSAWSSHCL